MKAGHTLLCKTIGMYRVPLQLEVSIWHLKFSNSSLANTNIKSSGKRLIYQLDSNQSKAGATCYYVDALRIEFDRIRRNY